jgi:hypothetical protein
MSSEARDAAEADYSAALKQSGKVPASLYGRGMARLKRGETDAGNADIADAKALDPNIATEFARYRVQ